MTEITTEMALAEHAARLSDSLDAALADRDKVGNEGLYSVLVSARQSLDEAMREHDRLSGSLDAALAAVDQAKADHQSDIDQITAVLHRQAIERDWCSYYDEQVKALNARLKRPIAVRHVRHDVSVEGSVSVEFQASFAILVPAGATDEQVEQAAYDEFKRRGLERYDFESWDSGDLEPQDLRFNL